MRVCHVIGEREHVYKREKKRFGEKILQIYIYYIRGKKYFSSNLIFLVYYVEKLQFFKP
jgi:hypothetical protein